MSASSGSGRCESRRPSDGRAEGGGEGHREVEPGARRGRRPARSRAWPAYVETVVNPPSRPGPRVTATRGERRTTASGQQAERERADHVDGERRPGEAASRRPWRRRRQRSRAPAAPPAATRSRSRPRSGRRLTRPGSCWASSPCRSRAVPRLRARAVELPDELAEQPQWTRAARACGQGQQPLGAAEGVGEVEHLEHRHEDRGGLGDHRERQVDSWPASALGARSICSAKAVGELALEAGEHRGQVGGQRVGVLVGEGQQPQLAAQVGVLVAQRA